MFDHVVGVFVQLFAAVLPPLTQRCSRPEERPGLPLPHVGPLQPSASSASLGVFVTAQRERAAGGNV